MHKSKILLLLTVVFLAVYSCKKDNGSGVVTIPPEPLSDVVGVNAEQIEVFLKTHTYNYEAFESPEANFDYEIRVDTLIGGSLKKSLFELATQELYLLVLIITELILMR